QTRWGLTSSFVILLFLCISCATWSPAGTQEASSLPVAQSQNSIIRTDQEHHLQQLIRQKRWNEAAQWLQDLSREYPNNPDIDYWQGVVRFQLKDPIGAIMAFRAAERLGLDTAALHKSLGLTYYLIHQYMLFELEMKKATQVNPSDNEPFYYLGRYYETTRNNFARALQLFDRALELKPDNAKSLYNRGYCLEMLGRLTAAEDNYEKAIQLTKDSRERFSWPYQGMASVLLKTDPQQALSFAQEAIELQPKLDSNHLILAKVEEHLGNLSEAIQEFQLAAQLDLTNAAPHYSLSRLYAKIGDRKAAQTQLKIFKELNDVYGPQ
ncbi:MAG: tetratricopeptide repeat protein, partial [Nitrososphaerales archaeon]